jgi:phosphoribosylaminoimidazole-succinocarboxamide synthase
MLHGALGKRILIYEGSSKLIYNGVDINTLIIHFNRCDEYDGWRNKISESLWIYLKNIGIKNHFIRTLSVREHLINSVDVYPIFVRIHSISHDDLRTRLGIEEGTFFPEPLVEWYLKSKFLNDPMVSRDHIEYFGWLQSHELQAIKFLAMRTNDVLRALFCCLGLKISFIELGFGVKNGEILLVGELSPETIKFWDEQSFKVMSLKDTYEALRLMPIQYLKC